ncbi:helix-turn-helix domain-containing protein [Acidipropionibacterium jensenii]|uniref:helix-turn-helix domain-containing protein n=1 Tax=Acidipropionibacterium jensenii TaxID=1749 RepID=UPI001585F209|nr:helix-turn-helix transcriptional regulator [Acidipropionibacterium jensenii]
MANIKAAREARGWSQRQLVEAMHRRGFAMTQTTMTRVESFKRDLKLNEIADICRTLHIDPEDIALNPDDFKGELEVSTRRGAYADAADALESACKEYETACRALYSIGVQDDEVYIDPDPFTFWGRLARTSCVGIAKQTYEDGAGKWRRGNADALAPDDPMSGDGRS